MRELEELVYAMVDTNKRSQISEDEWFLLAGKLFDACLRQKGRGKGKTVEQATKERETFDRVQALIEGGLSKNKAIKQYQLEVVAKTGRTITEKAIRGHIESAKKRDQAFVKSFEDFCDEQRKIPLEDKIAEWKNK